MHKPTIATFLLLASLTLPVAADAPSSDPGSPGAGGSDADGFLERYSETFRFRLGRPTDVKVLPDGRTVLFLRSGPRSFVRDLYELDLETGSERVLLSAGDLLQGQQEQLTAEEKARRERMRLAARGIASYQLSADGELLLVPLGGRLFVVDRAKGKVRELASEGGAPIDPRFSPDATKVACVRDGELYVIDVASGEEMQLTRGAGGTISHGLAEFVAQEEMGRYHGFWWSPDSTRLVYQVTDTAGVEVFHIGDATHPEKQPDSWAYPRAGTQNASVRLGIVPVTGGETTWIDWDREAYEYLAAVTWDADAPLTLLVQNRRQTVERLLAVDPGDGSTSLLLEETDDAWLNLHDGMPYWLPDGQQFLWITERNGAEQLELRGRDGRLVRALTALDLGLQAFERHLPEQNATIVRASQDPTQSHLFRISLDPRTPAVEPLTEATGVHRVVSSGPAPVFVVHSGGPDGADDYVVVDVNGRSLGQLGSVAEQPGLLPSLEFVTVGRDPDYRAVLVRPRDFASGDSYPVIVHVYGGPGAQMVRRDWRRYLIDQWFADHGYVVVAIDGRGTPGRGRAWERSTKGDLIDLPLGDQVRALQALGQRFPELDLSRVGIHGWSFGGYFTAMAVTRRPEVFRVGVAGAPVTTWEDYDTHYTERYMDLPQNNPEGYSAASVVTYAPQLRRPLLLVHGTADDNVYFMHSLKLADALMRDGRDFEFLPLPGFTHMVTEPEVSRRLYLRILEAFDEQLAQGPGGGQGSP
jgi:dipeptidyl-peptidase-4